RGITEPGSGAGWGSSSAMFRVLAASTGRDGLGSGASCALDCCEAVALAALVPGQVAIESTADAGGTVGGLMHRAPTGSTPTLAAPARAQRSAPRPVYDSPRVPEPAVAL